jgi:hypothetical protein
MCVLFYRKYPAYREIKIVPQITLPQPLFPVFTHIHKQSSAIVHREG